MLQGTVQVAVAAPDLNIGKGALGWEGGGGSVLLLQASGAGG